MSGPAGLAVGAGGTPGTTQFLYDPGSTPGAGGDELVAEYNASGTMLRRYVHGLGTDDPILWYEGATLTQRRSLQADHQGSIIGVANSSGASIAINAYDAWGIPNSTNLGRFQYTGQIFLPELGMYHYKARLYSPTLGRFLQTDPVGYEDQVNLYAYVGNDPVNLVDPTGKAAVPLLIPAGVALGGAIVTCAGSGVCKRFSDATRRAISTGVRSIERLFNENSNTQSEGKRIRVDESGKVHGNLPEADEVAGDDLKESAEALDSSIRVREQAIRDHPVGDPNGNARERREHRQHEQHKERVRREEGLRDQLRDRIQK